ncbi:Small-conductance mechanosensitive channel [Salinihabitans flavidus]|uniref:Small-conductance mechanosensitive channel n=1 Tax=Salinihabitans flavidus TaxID=569882 RepID=A0A1H8MTJ6_9RHOB|nr:mechanosensitive ion channel family protein [Salinihabitans flavidus]SEO20619.1 Small-conductance mechanosensitive channel [Salinihabitans flavidus]
MTLRPIALLLWLCALLTFAPLGAGAQMQSLAADAIGSSASAEEGNDVSRILQQAVRDGSRVIVIDRAGQVAAAGTVPGEADHTLLMRVQQEIDGFREVLWQRLAALPVAFNEVRYILRASSPDGRIFTFAETALWVFVLLGVGFLVERQVYARWIARPVVVSMIREAPEGYSGKLPYQVVRVAMGLIGVLVSMAVAALLRVGLFGVAGDSAIRFTIFSVHVAYFLSRAVALIWRMILSPNLTQYRIPKLSDRDARRLYLWLCVLAAGDIWSLTFANWLAELGLNYDVFAVMSGGLQLVIVALTVALVSVNYRAISGALRNGRRPEEVSAPLRVISTLWLPVLILYAAISWARLAMDLVLERATSIPLTAAGYGIAMSALIVYAALSYLIERYFKRSRRARPHTDEAEALAPVPQRNLSSFEDLARRVAGILAIVAGLYASVRVWGASTMMAGSSYAESVLDIVVIGFLGYIVFHAFRIWIDAKIAREAGDAPELEAGDEGGAGGASRLATLLPLFRNFILIIIAVAIALIALLEMGINVSPLFAGAGVVGLAIGFGAQSLVRDIFSGAFFLFDDAFRKGEYIDIGSVKGTVEKISVRSFQLRHHLGPLHTIPFGEIQFLTNYSRDWVIMKLPLRVTYDTDVEKVRKLIKKLGEELLDDPVIGSNFTQPLKSQGVIEMQDSAMIIRVKFMTKPGDQWLVRKKVFQEIRDLFEREGIRFAHREVTVRLADGKAEDLSREEREAVAAAALGENEEGTPKR